MENIRETETVLDIFSKINKITYVKKEELMLIVFFSILSSFLYLIIPVAAQGLVTFVSFGQITQPLYILSFCVLIALLSGATINLLQIYLVENIQQRLFVYNALDFAKKIPKVIMEIFDYHRGTELNNRYFDIFIVQKTIVDLLLSGIIFLLQTILGMALLAFYHPYFLVFDVFLFSAFVACIFFPFKKALYFAILESNAKYKVAAWLEEMSRVPLLFRFNKNDAFGFKIADEKVCDYIKQRQNHFRKILTHAVGSYLIQTVSITSLLILGGFLVIKNQLSLGQLVAAEVVVAAIGQGAQKLSKNIESLYDLIAASEKLKFLIELPIENSNDFDKRKNVSHFQSPPDVLVENLSFENENNESFIKNISFKVLPKETLVIFSEHGKGKSLLCRLLTNISKPTSGSITYNKINIKDFTNKALREKISFLSKPELFDGTLFENLVMSNHHISLEEVSNAIHIFGLEKLISKLESGLFTRINENHYQISYSNQLMLMFVRAYLAKPYFLIIDQTIDFMSDKDSEFISGLINKKIFNSTVIITTSDKKLSQYFDKVISL